MSIPLELPLDQQLLRLKQQLAQAQRAATLGELLSTTTHEFNNVLTTIINYARLGLRDSDDETREKAFNKILNASQRAAKITGSVLGMSRRRGEKLEPTSLAEVVEEALVLLEREMNKYHVAVEKYFRPAPPALVNSGQIQQVLLNLLVNARQAMPNGGRVIIKIEPDADGETVNLTVRDTGCGIEPETLRHIFEPHFTTKNGPDATGKGGAGLGLSTCREIIEAHQGRIRVESTPGRGTAFTLKLPAAGQPSRDTRPIAETQAAKSGAAVS